MFTILILAMLLRWVIQSLDSIAEWKMNPQVFWMEDAGVTPLFWYKHKINRQTHHIDQLRWGMPPCWRQRVCSLYRAHRQTSTAVLDADVLRELCSTSDGDLSQPALHSCPLLRYTQSSLSPALLCASVQFSVLCFKCYF